MEFSDEESREEIAPVSVNEPSANVDVAHSVADVDASAAIGSQPAMDAQEPSAEGDAGDEISEEMDNSLAFPTARVVRILRQEIRSGKQIRSEVKSAANDWLGGALRKVARDMDRSPYGSIGLADFQRAIKPFEMINHLVKDQERIMLAIEKLKHDADQIKRDLLRFYTNLTGEEQQADE